MIFHSDDLLTTPALSNLESLDEIVQFLELSDSFYGTDVSSIIGNGAGDFVWASGSTDLTIDSEKSVVSLDENFSGNIDIYANISSVFLNKSAPHSLKVIEEDSTLNLFLTPDYDQIYELSGNMSQLNIFSSSSLIDAANLVEGEDSTSLIIGNTTIKINLLTVESVQVFNPDGTLALEQIAPEEMSGSYSEKAEPSGLTDEKNELIFEQSSDLLLPPSAVMVEGFHETDANSISESLIFEAPSIKVEGLQSLNPSYSDTQVDIDVNFKDFQVHVDPEDSLEAVLQIGDMSFDQLYQDEDPTALIADL